MNKLTLTTSLLALASVSCGAEDGRSGVEEPLRVHDAQFFEGDLPGLAADVETDQEDLPTVTSATAEAAALFERMANIQFSGLASRDAASVGVQIKGEGSGYFLLPTGAVDAQDDRALNWAFIADFQQDLPPGRHELLTVAFNSDGQAGKQATTSVCVRSLRPDNGNACFPTVAPPALVLSVEWDTPVDLDLALVLPDGQVIDAKHPAPAPEDPTAPASAPTMHLNGDGNGGCHIDGRQREDLIFDVAPASGKYQIYVNLARNCGEHAVSYMVSRHRRVALENDEFEVESRDLGAGTLIADQANGGAKLGTYVSTLTIQ
jgi:hypothetical protein